MVTINIAAALVLITIMALLNVAWCSKCMVKKKGLNDIFKKFEMSGAKHLRVGEEGIDAYEKDNLRERLEEKQALLAADASRQSQS